MHSLSLFVSLSWDIRVSPLLLSPLLTVTSIFDFSNTPIPAGIARRGTMVWHRHGGSAVARCVCPRGAPRSQALLGPHKRYARGHVVRAEGEASRARPVGRTVAGACARPHAPKPKRRGFGRLKRIEKHEGCAFARPSLKSGQEFGQQGVEKSEPPR